MAEAFELTTFDVRAFDTGWRAGLQVNVAGVDRTGELLRNDCQVEICDPLNDRPTMRMKMRATAPASAYRPNPDDEIVAYRDGEAIFGGLVVTPNESGREVLFTTVDAAGFAIFAEFFYVTWSADADMTVKAVLQTLVTNYFTNYGVTLDAAQVDGPTIPKASLTFKYKRGDELLNDLCMLAREAVNFPNGMYWAVSPTKVLGMYKIGDTAAPFNITADTQFLGEPAFKRSRASNYANYVKLVCGGDQQVSKTDTWTADGLAHGGTTTYVATYPATPDYVSYVTVGGIAIGMNTQGWSWNATTHTLSHDDSGGLTPVGTQIVLTYTAQFPFEAISDGGVTPRREAVLTKDDCADMTAGLAFAAAYRARMQVERKEFTYSTRTGGIAKGQMQNITCSKRGIASPTAHLIHEVKTRIITGTELFAYDITAVQGSEFLGSWRDWYKPASGSSIPVAGGGSALVGTGEVPAGTILPFSGAATPTGYLACDGSAVSRTTYAALFAAIGVSWGSGNGTTTFTLPDGRGKSFLGAVGGHAIGSSFGTLDHAHTITLSGSVDSAGAHAHSGSTIGDHTHDYSGTTSTSADTVVAGGGGATASADSHDHGYSGTTGVASTTSLSIASDGAHQHGTSGVSGSAAANNPPYFVGAWIIKY